MKLYTPAEIAQFVSSHDLRDATEREIIQALKEWDKQLKAETPSVGREAFFLE
jgi:hypothetical protein